MVKQKMNKTAQNIMMGCMKLPCSETEPSWNAAQVTTVPILGAKASKSYGSQTSFEGVKYL